MNLLDEAYYLQHAACPRCFNRNGNGGEQITIGCIGPIDVNRYICDCGWRGIVDELIPDQPPEAVPPGPSDGAERLHAWFGLSYANYLTVPRSILQSMQPEWQGKLADLLDELQAVLRREGIAWPEPGLEVAVDVKTPTGLLVQDDMADYQRGRRRLW